MNPLRPINTYYGSNSNKSTPNYIEMKAINIPKSYVYIVKKYLDNILQLFEQDVKSPLFNGTLTTEYYLIRDLSDHYHRPDSEFNDEDIAALLRIIQMNLDSRTARTSFLLNDALIDTVIDVFELEGCVKRKVYFNL